MKSLEPNQLRDLFEAFHWLERGKSVVLMPPKGALMLPPQGPHVAVEQLANRSGNFVGLWSSGTTGAPRLFWHSWETAKAALSRNQPQFAHHESPSTSDRTKHLPRLWASPFHPWTYAGFQVALHAWLTGAGVVSLTTDFADTCRILRAQRPDAISAPPTFLDLLMRADCPAGWAPRQMTIGGEPISVRFGLHLRRCFPRTHFTAVYASTELGILMRSRRVDGWYAAISLSKRFREWRIDDRILWVRADNTWCSTGDLAECRNGWLRLIGRGDRVANVGGWKVSLSEVSERALEVPGVRSAVAFALPTQVTGQIVGLRFAVETDELEEDVRDRIDRYLRKTLPKPAWPRHWEFGPCTITNGKAKGGL